jgi:hypothetical protein
MTSNREPEGVINNPQMVSLSFSQLRTRQVKKESIKKNHYYTILDTGCVISILDPYMV